MAAKKAMGAMKAIKAMKPVKAMKVTYHHNANPSEYHGQSPPREVASRSQGGCKLVTGNWQESKLQGSCREAADRPQEGK